MLASSFWVRNSLGNFPVPILSRQAACCVCVCVFEARFFRQEQSTVEFSMDAEPDVNLDPAFENPSRWQTATSPSVSGQKKVRVIAPSQVYRSVPSGAQVLLAFCGYFVAAAAHVEELKQVQTEPAMPHGTCLP